MIITITITITNDKTAQPSPPPHLANAHTNNPPLKLTQANPQLN